MQENKILINNKKLLPIIIAIFLAGMFLRFYQLGSNPLDNHEAAYALQAVDAASNKNNFPVQTDPLLVLGTAAVFFFFEDSTLLARVLPALFGSALILAPLFLQKKYSPTVLLILSIGLAFDPSLVAMSRTADSHIITLAVFSFLLIAMLWDKAIWFGILAGLLLLSGPNIGLLLLILSGVFIWDWFTGRSMINSLRKRFKKMSRKAILLSFFITFLLGGTLFLQHPESISAVFMGLNEFFVGWVSTESKLSISNIGIVLIAYELFVVVFGLWGIVYYSRQKENNQKNLLYWLIIVLFLVILFPARTAGDLIWVLVPLWVFAALQIEQTIQVFKKINWITIGLGIFYLVLLCFIILNWVSIVNNQFDQQQVVLRWLLIGGSILLMALVAFMVNYGWGMSFGTNSLLMAVFVFLIASCFLPATWSSAFLGNRPDLEFWRFAPFPGHSVYLKETIDDLSEWNHGDKESLEIVSVGVNDPSLQWLLREYRVKYVSALAPAASPEIIITPIYENGGWSASYTGQDFVIRQYPNWSLLFPQEWQQWYLHRNVDVTRELVILWTRTDIFPGSSIPGVED